MESSKRTASASSLWRLAGTFGERYLCCNRSNCWGELELFTAVIVLGFSYTIMKDAMAIGTIGPTTFKACEAAMSTFLLSITLLVRNYFDDEFSKKILAQYVDDSDRNTRQTNWKALCLWGTFIGVLLSLGSVTFLYGVEYVSAGEASFIVAMYVVLTPLAEWMLNCFTKCLPMHTWLAALLSFFGLYLLAGCSVESSCFGDSGSSTGVMYLILSMFCWTAYYIAVGYGAKKVDYLLLTTVTFMICSLICLSASLLFEYKYWQYPFSGIMDNFWLISVYSSLDTVSILLIARGLKSVPASSAVLILSLDSVFTALFSFFILGETMSYIQVCGAGIMLSSILINFWPWSDNDAPGGLEGEENQECIAADSSEDPVDRNDNDDRQESVACASRQPDAEVSFRKRERNNSAPSFPKLMSKGVKSYNAV